LAKDDFGNTGEIRLHVVDDEIIARSFEGFGRHDDDGRAAALELFEVIAKGQRGDRVADEADDRRFFFDEGNRAVLELAAGIGFGVDIGDFL
jgi:hypothetical protein